MVHGYDIRTEVPASIQLSWSRSAMEICPGCSKPIVTPVKLLPCEHTVCSSCSAPSSSAPQCITCKQEVTRFDVDADKLAKVKQLATAVCETCTFKGSFAEAAVHHCQGAGGAAVAPAAAPPAGPVHQPHPLEMEGSFVTHIYWDYDNITPPSGETILFYINIIKKLESIDFVYSRYFVNSTAYIRSGGEYEELALAAAKLRIDVHIAEKKQEAADRLISNDIRDLLRDIDIERANNGGHKVNHKVIIISGDNDFIDDIQACEAKDVTTCVLHDQDARAARVLEYHASKALRIEECFADDEEEESEEEESEPEPEPPAPTQTTKGGKKQQQQEVREAPKVAPKKAAVATYVEDDHLTVGGTKYHLTELVRNAGLTAAQEGTHAPVLCEIRGTHNITACKKIHPLAKLPGSAPKAAPTAAPAKAWGSNAAPAATVVSTTAAKPASAPTTIKVVAGMKNPEKVYIVEGETVPESKLIRNQALDYLDQNNHAKGKKCTNRNPHEAKECTYIHFKRVRK